MKYIFTLKWSFEDSFAVKYIYCYYYFGVTVFDDVIVVVDVIIAAVTIVVTIIIVIIKVTVVIIAAVIIVTIIVIVIIIKVTVVIIAAGIIVVTIIVIVIIINVTVVLQFTKLHSVRKDMMNPIDALTEFGLTRQEGSIYMILYAHVELTGYEIAKLAGISRSNVYSSLANLVEKGGVYLIEGSSNKYSAVPVDEFCDNKVRKLEQNKLHLTKLLASKPDDQEGYITIRGEQHIEDKMIHMLKQTTQRVYISVSRKILNLVEPYLSDLICKNCKVVIITNTPYELTGATIFNTPKESNQIRVIVDSKTVLTGDLENGNQSTCLFSRKSNLVDLLKESMQNEIKLIELTKSKVIEQKQ